MSVRVQEKANMIDIILILTQKLYKCVLVNCQAHQNSVVSKGLNFVYIMFQVKVCVSSRII